MTDKEQIIIDGVEVLKEKINMCFILLLNKLEKPETIEQTIYEHLDAFVKEWNAQLARKTQIIDDVEEVIKPYQEQIELDAFSLPIAIESILERKTQECEELKEKNALLESQMAFNLSEMEIRLGNEVNRSETLLKELKRFDKIKDEFREMSEKPKSENDRYRKALEEIEGLISDDEFIRCPINDDVNCNYFTRNKILDIINKAIGDKNTPL